ncbi:MAG: tetratricopeptide repeat protein [Chloroflexota bacterium]
MLRTTAEHFVHGCEYLEITSNTDQLQIIRHVAHLLQTGPDPSAINTDNYRQVLIHMQDQLRDARAQLLFLLDNVVFPDQVREILQELNAVTWIVTARRISLRRGGVQAVHLKPLDMSEAAAVFRAHLRGVVIPDGRNPQLERVVDKLGRLPIALRLGASCLAAGRFATVDELDQWLDAGGLQKGSVHFGKLTRLLDQMVADLPDDAQTLLMVCGAFSSPRIQTFHLRQVCRAAAVRLTPQVWDILGDYSLADYPDEFCVELHPLVHEYARTRLTRDSSQPVVRQALNDHYLAWAKDIATIEQSQRDYRPMIPEVQNFLRVSENFYDDRSWASLKLIWPALSGCLWNMGDYAKYEALDMKCLTAAQELGDDAWLAILLSELGYTKRVRGEWLEAESLFSQSKFIHDSYPDQLIEQARVRRYLAEVMVEMDNYNRALDRLTEADAVLNRVDPGTEDRLPTARMLLYSARMTAYHRIGDLAQAEAAGMTADRLFREIVITDEGNWLDGYQVELGDILLKCGHVQSAEVMWLELIRRRKDLLDLPEHAEARLRLAWLSAGRGDRDNALQWGAAAAETFARFGAVARYHQVEQFMEQIETEDDLPEFSTLFES